MAYHGHSVSRPFTFTAKGTNNQAIVANFNLYDVNTNNPIGLFATVAVWDGDALTVHDTTQIPACRARYAGGRVRH